MAVVIKCVYCYGVRRLTCCIRTEWQIQWSWGGSHKLECQAEKDKWRYEA